ncbi:uncharacterized protein LOC134654158 isoform X2 [Cydia amplana]|uniref:uncharacterized protein LOC134654158 isoform X2 n=1 Tax=Cydia amplana TaxID=1869771 RepID=UPI002FE5EBD6
MAPKVDQGTIIILDVGRNVSSPEEAEDKKESAPAEDNRTFFLKAKECAARIIERKIMTQAKNFVGVTLLGSKKTNNKMAEEVGGAFRHIDVLSPLQTPTWQMIRDLPEEVRNYRGDWFDALIVAADQFKDEMERANILNKKIILMTNFQSPAKINDDQVEMVVNGFKEENFEVDVIGLDLTDESHKGDDIDLARHFVEVTKGATATFDYAMRYLLFHKKKATSSAWHWNVELSIGPNIKIPISAFIRTKDEPVVKPWKKAIRDPVTSTSSTTEGVMRNKVLVNTENYSTVEAVDIVKGYHYGQQIIPLSEFDKSMLYEPGEKSLSVYGFTHADNIQWQNLNGDGLQYIFGRISDKKAQYAIRCLVESLHELNLVGLVRRVFNNGNAPKMFALMPVIDPIEDFLCLSMAGICFKEDIKNMAFPQTKFKKFACSNEQVNAFKDLIQAMDLTSAYDDTFDDTEAFPIAETVSPTIQYVLDCIAYRAMNPGKPLPEPRDDIMMLFRIPPLIEERSRDPINKLKQLLQLKKVEEKPKRKTKAQGRNDATMLDQSGNQDQSNGDLDMPKVQLPVLNNKGPVRIGTIDPIDDFQTLANNGKTLSDLAADMIDAIESLVYCNLDGNYSKAFGAIAFFRHECVKVDPSTYNTWLLTFRNALISRNNIDFVNAINEKMLSLIFKDEHPASTYDAENNHEDSQLYENDTVPDDTELSIKPEINDLYDEMI